MTRLLRSLLSRHRLPSVATTAAQAQQIRVIAANPQGSIFYAASVAIGKLMDDKLKMQVRVQPMAGSSTYIPLLDRGEVDFGLTNVDDARTTYKGVGSFRQANPNLRLTAIAFPLTLGVLVPNDSPIKTIADLKGKTMPWGYNAQTTGRVLQEAVLASAGLTMNDVKTGADPELVLRRRSARRRQGRGGHDLHRHRPGAAGQRQSCLARRRPLPQHGFFAGGARARFASPAGAADRGAARAACGRHHRSDDDHGLQHFLHHQRQDAGRRGLQHRQDASRQQGRTGQGPPGVPDFEPKDMNEEIGVPWHPGAIKFYKEIGQWPPKTS